MQAISKWYGNVVAVNDMSFEIYPGVTGILGPNGAGKTTLLSMMCGLLRPSRGDVRVLGEEVVGNVGLYRRVGIMLEHDALYPFMTGRGFVELAAKLQGVTDPEAVDWAISTVNLQDAQGRPTGTYSRGMRQRIRLAATIVHDPEVLVLDEPLNGTDPRQRVEFAEFVERLRTAGRTVLISSHILEEVEALADRILLVVSGKLAASGNHRDIREKLDERPFQVRIMASNQREMAAALVRLESVESVRLEDGAIEVTTRNLADLQRNVPRLARDTREPAVPHRAAGRLAGERLLLRGAAVIGALFLLALRQAASPRRLLLLGAISLFPVGLAYLLVRLGDADQGDLVGGVVEGLVISLVLPLVTMVLATGAFGNEVEDRTLSLLTTKPVPRWSLVLSKLMATIVVAGPIMVVVAIVVTAMPPDREGGVMLAAAVGAAVGVAVYASVFTWAGLVTTKALAFGLVYVLLWEALITGFLSGTRYLSIRGYTIGVIHGMEGSPFSGDLAIGYTTAVAGAVVVTVAFFALAVRRLSRMDVL